MNFGLLIAAFTTLLTTQGWAQPAPSRATDTDRDAITAVHQREMSLFGARDIDGVLAVYTDDVTLMPPNQPAIVGKPAVRVWLQNIYRQYRVEDPNPSVSELVILGDVAIERYVYALKLTPIGGGAVIEDVGKGIHIFRRQADGSWKIAQDVWNADKLAP
jgi:ketosteroid isomerase-like protein